MIAILYERLSIHNIDVKESLFLVLYGTPPPNFVWLDECWEREVVGELRGQN